MAYNPSKHIPLSKPMGAVNFPIDARTYFYDEVNFVYRPYISKLEVLATIGENFRKGSFDIVVNEGGTLSNGVIIGGKNSIFWFDINGELVRKNIDFEDNDQFPFVLVDAINKILLYIRSSGKFGATSWDENNIPGTALMDGAITTPKLSQDVLDNFLTEESIEPIILPFQETKDYVDENVKPVIDITETQDWSIVFVDQDLKIIGGANSQGKWDFKDIVEKSISGAAIKESTLAKESLDQELKTLLLQPLDLNTGYYFAIVTEDNKILFAIDSNFNLIGNYQANIADGSITISKLEPSIQQALLNGGSNLINCIGDSLTRGGSGNNYPLVLQNLLGNKYQVINNGIGGETAATISARIGGVPAFVTEGFTLPGNGSEVTISSVSNPRIKNSPYGTRIETLRQSEDPGLSVNPCIIQGENVILRYVGSSPTDPDAYWTLRKAVADGVDKNIIANSQLTTAFSKKYRSPYVGIFFIGQNGGYDSIDSRLVDYIKKDIEYVGAKYSLVIGLHTGTPASRASLEKACRDEFGERYLNLREYISQYALSDLGITPTADDLAAMAAGTFPPSLWAAPNDPIHGNANFNKAVGEFIYRTMIEQGIIKI